MHHRTRLALLLSFTLVALSTTAFAQETSETPPSPADSASPAPAPAASETTTPAAEETAAATTAEAAAGKMADKAHFGLAARWRWVSVPGWFLGLFAQKNVPLSTFNCWALEGFWRKHDKEDRNRTWEIVVAVGYQNMSPPDGYWLGRGKSITDDTDLVQVKGLGLITMDAAYVLRQYFSPYFGIHYGAGLGLGVVRGKVLRTSATCDPATGQCQVIIPNVCGGGNPPCTEVQLSQSGVRKDNGPGDPHRFEETSVPSALPIINLLFGLDFPIPDAKGLEFRLEGGFYDAFFVGVSGGYAF
jgi:hypothetical protein